MFGSKDKDKRIQELESDLRAAVVELNRVRQEARGQRLTIVHLQQTVEDRNHTINQQMEAVGGYKRQIADLERAHSSQKERQRASENVIRNLRAEISGDRLKINDLRKELEWHKQRLQDAEETPAIQAVFTNDPMLACQLEAANGEIKKLRATITEQDGRIHELRGRVEARNDMLAKQSDVVTKLEQAQEHLGVQVQARDQKIAYLNSVVAMNERAISAGASALGNKEATIRQCEAVIASLRKEIEGQKVSLANYSRELGACEKRIAEQDDALVILRMKLNTKDQEIESYRSSNRTAADNIRKLMDEIESGKMTRRGAVENIRLLSDMCDQLKKLLKEKETLLAMQQQTICKREDEIRDLKDSSQFATISHYEDRILALKAERDRLKTNLDGVWSAKEDLTKQFNAIKKVKDSFAREVSALTKDYTTLKDANGKLLVQLEAAEAHIGRRDREAHEFQSVCLRQRAETDKLIKCVEAQAHTIANQKSIIATLSTVIETYIRK